MTAFTRSVTDPCGSRDNLSVTYTSNGIAPKAAPSPPRPHLNVLFGQTSWLVKTNPISNVGRPVLTQRKDTT